MCLCNDMKFTLHSFANSAGVYGIESKTADVISFLTGLLAVFSCSLLCVYNFSTFHPFLTFLCLSFGLFDSIRFSPLPISSTPIRLYFSVSFFIPLLVSLSLSTWYPLSFFPPSTSGPCHSMSFLFVSLEFSGRESLPLSSSIFLFARSSITLLFQFVSWLGFLSIAFHFAIALARKMNLAFIGFELNVWATYTHFNHILAAWAREKRKKGSGFLSRSFTFAAFFSFYFHFSFSFILFIHVVLSVSLCWIVGRFFLCDIIKKRAECDANRAKSSKHYSQKHTER